MVITTPPRDRVKALAHGRGDGGGIAVPLAARFAARIQEREWDDFVVEPTQLANGLRDLVDAVAPDGITVTIPGELRGPDLDLTTSEHVAAALEATERLRSSMGDRVALVACLPGGDTVVGGAQAVITAGTAFLDAGVDVVVVLDADDEAPESLASLGNIARFHEAVALGCHPGDGLPTVERIPFDDPRAATGVALTDEEVARDVDVDDLEDWMDAVRG